MQSRTVLTVHGEPRYRSVQDVARDDAGRLESFRWVKVSDEGEEDLRGVMQGDQLAVLDANGQTVSVVPWSDEHRLGGPNKDDLLATGFAEGATVTRRIYEPWHDPRGVHLATYTVLTPVSYKRYDGEVVTAHRLRIDSGNPNLTGGQLFVDDAASMLRAEFTLPVSPAPGLGGTEIIMELVANPVLAE